MRLAVLDLCLVVKFMLNRATCWGVTPVGSVRLEEERSDNRQHLRGSFYRTGFHQQHSAPQDRREGKLFSGTTPVKDNLLCLVTVMLSEETKAHKLRTRYFHPKK